MVEVLAPAAAPPAAEGGDVCAREQRTDIPARHGPQAPTLRPYQHDVIARFDAEIAAGRRRVLLVAPTGSGKTVIAAAIIKGAAYQRRRVLFLDHRREITAQTIDKLYRLGIDAGVIQAGFPARPAVPVQVASVQTLHARAVRGRTLKLPRADLVVVDEAHHVRARTYERILDLYPNAIILGLTARPCRADGRGLGNVFDILIEAVSVADLVRDGYLVSIRIYAPSRPDLTGIWVRRGDYVETQLAERVDTVQLVGDIVEHWLRLAERRRTVIFAIGVAHNIHIRDEFRRAGVLAEHIDGSTPPNERDRVLAQLAAGTVEIVTNAMVLTEGWDRPEVSCLVLARPTKSLGLYRQMVGRVLRPHLGKRDALILDHAGADFAHGFPDDPVDWTLAEDRLAENKTHATRGKPHGATLATCPECQAVRFRGQPCTVCSWRPVEKPEVVAVADGELGEVDRQRQVRPNTYGSLEKVQFYSQLLFISRHKGYKDGWAAHKFKEKFGVWPARRYVEPTPPEPKTLAWVRSRQIAYAKAMQKQRAAQ